MRATFQDSQNYLLPRHFYYLRLLYKFNGKLNHTLIIFLGKSGQRRLWKKFCLKKCPFNWDQKISDIYIWIHHIKRFFFEKIKCTTPFVLNPLVPTAPLVARLPLWTSIARVLEESWRFQCPGLVFRFDRKKSAKIAIYAFHFLQDFFHTIRSTSIDKII